MSLLERIESCVGTLDEPRARAVLLPLLQDPAALAGAVRRHGGARAALDSGEAWTAAQERGLAEAAVVEAARAELDLADRFGVTLLVPGGEGWPSLLDGAVSPPALLHVRGRLPDESCGPPLAMVGSRQKVSYGTRVAREFAAAWASLGGVVVSGGAAGVDTAAHEGCLEAGGTTVAVMGIGLAGCYPRANAALFERIAGSGALVSELPMSAQGLSFHFPRRNRIIAGLSRGVVVVQAREGSGALHTATFALKSGRRLFTVPGPVDDESCRGGLELLAKGVPAMVSTGQLAGLYEALAGAPGRAAEGSGGRLPFGPPARRTVSPDGLQSGERLLVETLSGSAMHIDDLGLETGLEPASLAAGLLELEMRGWVERRPGNRYRSTVDLEER